MNKKLVSVIIPVYNVEQYLGRCVNSVLNQSYTNLEIILVDDGSKDSSGILCDKIAKEDNRIIVIHKKNEGLSSARNKALDNCCGKYITFVDSDDAIHSHMIEWMVDEIENNNVDFVSTELLPFSDQYPAEVDKKVSFHQLTRYDFINHLYPYNFGKISVTACGKLYKAELFSELRYPEGIIYEDLHVYLPLLLKCKLISIANEPLYYWYNNNHSITRSDYMKYERFGEFAVREQYIVFFEQEGLAEQQAYAENDYLTFFMRNYFAVKIKYKCLEKKLLPHVKIYKTHLPRIRNNEYCCRMRRLCASLMLYFPHIAYVIAKRAIPDCLIEELR